MSARARLRWDSCSGRSRRRGCDDRRSTSRARGIDPALDLKKLLTALCIDMKGDGLGNGLRSAREFDGVVAIGQAHLLAIAPIDLPLKPEIRREPLGRRGVNAFGAIKDEQAGRGRLALFVADFQGDFAGRRGGEENGRLAAKTEVLRSLADVKLERGFALAGIARKERDDAVLEFETGKSRRQRGLVEKLDVEPKIGRIDRGGGCAARSEPAIARVPCRTAGIDGLRLRAEDVQRSGRACFVDDLDQKLAPALLD